RAGRAGARQAERNPTRKRLALAGQQRRVGGDDADAGAGAGRPATEISFHRIVGGKLMSERDAGNGDFLARAEIGLQEDADGIGAMTVVDDPRSAAGSALE